MTLPSRTLAVAAFLLTAAAAPVAAQGLTSRPARAEDVNSIDAIIDAFYDVISHAPGEPIDWARDSTLYLAETEFKIVSGSGADTRITVLDHAAFAAANSDVTSGFIEHEINRVTQRFGNLAQAFSTYAWRTSPDGPVGGRGINSIELVFDGTRWWISSAAWTSESADQPIPAEYLPAG